MSHERGCTGTLPVITDCHICNNKGFTETTKRENKVVSTEYTLCTCERGKELGKLWDKYPAWVGAPYSFFYLY